MTKRKGTDEVHGHTKSGKPITNDMLDRWADEAEKGYDVDELLTRRRGRPAIGPVESFRLPPELRERVVERADADGTTVSDVSRRALAEYLGAAN